MSRGTSALSRSWNERTNSTLQALSQEPSAPLCRASSWSSWSLSSSCVSTGRSSEVPSKRPQPAAAMSSWRLSGYPTTAPFYETTIDNQFMEILGSKDKANRRRFQAWLMKAEMGPAGADPRYQAVVIRALTDRSASPPRAIAHERGSVLRRWLACGSSNGSTRRSPQPQRELDREHTWSTSSHTGRSAPRPDGVSTPHALPCSGRLLRPSHDGRSTLRRDRVFRVSDGDVPAVRPSFASPARPPAARGAQLAPTVRRPARESEVRVSAVQQRVVVRLLYGDSKPIT